MYCKKIWYDTFLYRHFVPPLDRGQDSVLFNVDFFFFFNLRNAPFFLTGEDQLKLSVEETTPYLETPTNHSSVRPWYWRTFVCHHQQKMFICACNLPRSNISGCTWMAHGQTSVLLCVFSMLLSQYILYFYHVLCRICTKHPVKSAKLFQQLLTPVPS